MLPHAREDRLVVRDLAEEVVVYDLKRHHAHYLNRTAALLWRHCDGRTTVAELARLLEKELSVPADEAVVWMALDQLRKAQLLRDGLTPPAGTKRYSRREVLRRVGLVGAAALVPAVMSIVAPPAAQAASCQNSCVGRPKLSLCEFPDCTKWCCPDSSGIMKCVSAGDQTCL